MYTQITEIQKDKAWATSFAVASTNDYFAVALRDYSIRLHQLANIHQERILQGHNSQISCLLFSPNGQQLFSGDVSGVVCIWNVTTGTCTQRLEEAAFPFPIHAIFYIPSAPQQPPNRLLIINVTREKLLAARMYSFGLFSESLDYLGKFLNFSISKSGEKIAATMAHELTPPIVDYRRGDIPATYRYELRIYDLITRLANQGALEACQGKNPADLTGRFFNDPSLEHLLIHSPVFNYAGNEIAFIFNREIRIYQLNPVNNLFIYNRTMVATADSAYYYDTVSYLPNDIQLLLIAEKSQIVSDGGSDGPQYGYKGEIFLLNGANVLNAGGCKYDYKNAIYSPAGDQLIANNMEHTTLTVFDSHTLNVSQDINTGYEGWMAHNKKIYAQFVSNGQRLVTVCNSGHIWSSVTIRLWDTHLAAPAGVGLLPAAVPVGGAQPAAANAQAAAQPAAANAQAAGAQPAPANAQPAAAAPIVIIPAGLNRQPANPDGNCFYYSVEPYLDKNVAELRALVADYIENHLNLFTPFMQLPAGRTPAQHIQLIKHHNEWASNLEIEVLMRVTNRPIVVLEANGQITNRQDILRFPGSPIFVFYNGENHYDKLIIQHGYQARELLVQIQQANADQVNAQISLLARFLVIIDNEQMALQQIRGQSRCYKLGSFFAPVLIGVMTEGWLVTIAMAGIKFLAFCAIWCLPQYVQRACYAIISCYFMYKQAVSTAVVFPLSVALTKVIQAIPENQALLKMECHGLLLALLEVGVKEIKTIKNMDKQVQSTVDGIIERQWRNLYPAPSGRPASPVDAPPPAEQAEQYAASSDDQQNPAAKRAHTASPNPENVTGLEETPTDTTAPTDHTPAPEKAMPAPPQACSTVYFFSTPILTSHNYARHVGLIIQYGDKFYKIELDMSFFKNKINCREIDDFVRQAGAKGTLEGDWLMKMGTTNATPEEIKRLFQDWKHKYPVYVFNDENCRAALNNVTLQIPWVSLVDKIKQHAAGFSADACKQLEKIIRYSGFNVPDFLSSTLPQ